MFQQVLSLQGLEQMEIEREATVAVEFTEHCIGREVKVRKIRSQNEKMTEGNIIKFNKSV